ncbi:MAG TPA: guanylate kinase [Gammaproteobacteria bacterium]|nr:guanylate kinase [Gammaproteobacteria bacterium]
MFAGTLFIVSAPSGAGKTSLLKALQERLDNLAMPVSCTTRAKRPGEQDGVDYHFITPADFARRVEAGDFIEYAEVFGNRYGTLRSTLEDQLEKDVDVVLEIDWQGARQVRAAMPEAISIFILPPSKEALQARLRARGQDSDEIIEGRMREAQAQMTHYDEYDFLLVNDVFEQALDDLELVFRANRLRQVSQCVRHGEILRDLLS